VRFVKGAVDALPAGARADEAYRLEIGARDLTIRAGTAAGAYWATRTLLQLLAQTNELPRGVVVDAPLYARRMLMLDVGRKPTPLPVLYDYLRLMAWHKMNELHLHLSDEAFGGGYTGMRVQCDTFPGLASEDLHYTKAELRALQDFAQARGIVITPEIDMPGHARAFTDYWPDLLIPGESKSYLDVTNPKTIERMKALLDELIPVFDAPDFHIGTDEYRIGGSPERKTELHEAFRKFINTMNAHIRSKGKNTRIWSGFEHMKGTTDIEGTVIIDMWETDDAKGQIARGHAVINSNHGRTYIVPGAHYYGVSNPGIYNSWEPWMVSGDATKNPTPDDPKLLGGKLHVWNDQGPTGYTQTEIAWLTRPQPARLRGEAVGHQGLPRLRRLPGPRRRRGARARRHAVRPPARPARRHRAGAGAGDHAGRRRRAGRVPGHGRPRRAGVAVDADAGGEAHGGL
jgi:hexosaminidase